MSVPAAVILAVLGTDPGRGTIRTPEDDRALNLTARHIERLGGGIDHMINGLHGKVERHELDDRLQAGHRRTDAQTGEPMLGNRGVNHPLGAELVQQTTAHLIGTLVLRDFLAHQEHVGVAAHLLGHGVAQCVADRHLHQGDPFGQLRVAQHDRRHRRRRDSGAHGITLGLGPGSRFRRSHCAHPTRQPRDDRVDLHLLGALGHQQRLDHALIDRLDLHRGLVGFDLGDHISGGDLVAHLDVPLR